MELKLTPKEALMALQCKKNGEGKTTAKTVTTSVRGKAKNPTAFDQYLPASIEEATRLWCELAEEGIAVEKSKPTAKVRKFALREGFNLPPEILEKAYPPKPKKTRAVKPKKPTTAKRLDAIEASIGISAGIPLEVTLLQRIEELEAKLAKLMGEGDKVIEIVEPGPTQPNQEISEDEARHLVRHAYERLQSELNTQSVPIPLMRRVLGEKIAADAIEPLLRQLEKEYIIDLQAASHIEIVPHDQRDGVIHDPYRGVLYYVLWRR